MYFGEKFNTYSHFIGLILSIIGATFLIIKSVDTVNEYKIVSNSIYSSTLIILYLISTLYHAIKPSIFKRILLKLDHCVIYLLIAGSYTPFTLISLNGIWGWSIFWVVWGIAILGLILEVTIPQKIMEKLSMVLYLAMGWVVVVAIYPLVKTLSYMALFWLVLGGILYTCGIYWFLNEGKIRHAHGIWHMFVLFASICHFISIYFYIT